MDDFAFLNTISSDCDAFWSCTISVSEQDIPFKVNTGAEVTVVSEKYTKILSKNLKPPSKQLHGPDSQPLSALGEIQATLTYKEKQATQTIFVVHNLQHNLVGLPAIRALDILTRINAISKPVKEQFPSLFTGLGTFPGSSNDIQLKPNAKPFALFTPRNVPLPLKQKVKDELTRKEALGVTTPVEEQTLWCAGMVVVPSCQTLTTFITPFGHYYFKRLPLGICSAPEHFQCRMSAILAGHDGGTLSHG